MLLIFRMVKRFHIARAEQLKNKQEVLRVVDVVELLLQVQVLVVQVIRHLSYNHRRTHAVFIKNKRATQEP